MDRNCSGVTRQCFPYSTAAWLRFVASVYENHSHRRAKSQSGESIPRRVIGTLDHDCVRPHDERSQCLRTPRNHACRPRSHFGRSQTSRDCLIARSAGMGNDTSGWTVIGRAKKNCLIRVNCGQIQDRRRARHQLGTRTAGRLAQHRRIARATVRQPFLVRRTGWQNRQRFSVFISSTLEASLRSCVPQVTAL
jgi:hypothetical protein